MTLTSNPPLFVPAVVKAVCNGNANGSVVFSPVGGVGPYQFSNNAGTTYQASATFTGLASGPQVFRIKDNVGCTKDTSITIPRPAVLLSTAVNNTATGCGNTDGVITTTTTGGTTPYAYTITGPTINSSGASTGIFTNLAAGSFTVTTTDGNGCTVSASATVALVDNLFLRIGADTTVCAATPLTFNVQTNATNAVFTWRSPDALPGTITNANTKNATVTPTDTATYILNATWGSCSREDTIKLNVLLKPVANAGTDTMICDNSYAILRGSATNLSGTVNYSWATLTGPAASGVDPSKPTTNVYPPGNNTTYVYTLTVTDNYNCKFAVTDVVNVRVQAPVPADAGTDTTAIRGIPQQLSGSGGTSYVWTPAAPLNNALVRNPVSTLQNDTRFLLKVTDAAGCIGYDSVLVRVFAKPAYYIPNAFSPNGDGLNDVFRAIPVGIVKTDFFRIFNRYGQIVFETSVLSKGWDGTYKGKKQPVSAYIWMIKGTDKDGKMIELKGTLLLLQ